MTFDSTSKTQNRKPAKPHKDFPLTPNGNGQWSKKIRGKVYYFGRWAEPLIALERYLEQKDDLLGGRVPRSRGKGFTVRDLVNRFLTAKQQQMAAGEIVDRTFQDYQNTCERLILSFGNGRLVEDLHSDDFASLRNQLSESRGLVSLFNEIGRVRVVFNFAYSEQLVDRPMRYGSAFRRPSRKVLRRERQKRGKKMFEVEQLRAILDAADGQLLAMIMLGINCGFGNADVGTLPIEAVDLRRGWVEYGRSKTGIERRCPLWPETLEALRLAEKSRPVVKDASASELFFVTKYGQGWAKQHSANPISAEFRKLIKEIGIYRKGVGFYALRHTFETIGGETADQVAVSYIMGHAKEDMSSVYRERISDQRLKNVCEHVRAWLYGEPAIENDDKNRHG